MSKPCPVPCPDCRGPAVLLTRPRQVRAVVRAAWGSIPEPVKAAMLEGKVEATAARCSSRRCRRMFVLTNAGDLPDGYVPTVECECPRCEATFKLDEGRASKALECPTCGFREEEPGPIEDEEPDA